MIGQAQDKLTQRDPGSVAHLISELVERFAVPAEQHRELGLGVLRVNEQVLQEARRRLYEGAMDPIEPLRGSVSAATATATATTPAHEPSELFSVVAAEYLRLRAPDRDGGMRGQTIDQNTATFEMFREVVGDLPFKAITRTETSKFLGVLELLPPLYSKSPEWRGMSLQEIVAAVEAKPGVTKRMTKKTQQRHFAALSGLFEHLISRKGHPGPNPARGFKFKSKRNPRNERDAWTADELAQLFASPIWAGCRSEKGRTTPGPHIFRNAMYWVPILCAFHGARLEEMAQLRRCDVKQAKGIWYFDISDEGDRNTKNEESNRKVPLHPFVVEIGFLEWLGNPAQDPDAMVFTDLKPHGADGKYGPAITKKFGIYTKALGLGSDKTVLHSMRHSAVTALIQAGAQQVLQREITGHKQQGEDHIRYFKGDLMAGLQRTVSLIRWPGAEAALRESSARLLRRAE